MIHFEGDRMIPLPVETVASKLSDAAFVVSCLDKVEKVTESSADKAVLKIKTGFSFLSASLDVTITVLERGATWVKYRAFSKGVGATSVTEATLIFAEKDGGTFIHYTADVIERTGLLKIVSSGLIQSTAKSVIDDTWNSVEAKMRS
jgi:carbon monoxide dehydrogenase subunit G